MSSFDTVKVKKFKALKREEKDQIESKILRMKNKKSVCFRIIPVLRVQDPWSTFKGDYRSPGTG